MSKKKRLSKTKVIEKVKEFFKKARASKTKHMSDRNIRKGRNLAMKYRTKIPKELKIQYCKHCHTLFKPGENCRVRIGNSQVVYYCYNCKKYTKYPYRKEQKEKRKNREKQSVQKTEKKIKEKKKK